MRLAGWSGRRASMSASHSGSAYGLVFRSYGHLFNPTVTIRPKPTAAALPRTAELLVF